MSKRQEYRGLAVALAVGAGCIGFSLYLGNEFRRHQSESLSIAGVVVALRESCSDDCAYSPVVEYVVDGEEYRVEGRTAANPPAFEVGEVVEVLYHAERPGEARINALSESWGPPALLMAFGLAFTAGGLGGLISAWRRRRREQLAAGPPPPH